MEGIVTAALPNAVFTVEITEEETKRTCVVSAHTCGKMRRSKVRILVGDTVVMEFSKHDLKKGRITRRKKTEKKTN